MKRVVTLGALALSAYFAVKGIAGRRSPTHEARSEGSGPAIDTSSQAPITPSSLVVVSSGPVVEERTDYYDVSGSSDRELHLAMGTLGPKGAEGVAPGVSSNAMTSWTVSWSWKPDYSYEQGRCAIKSVSTSVQIHTIMPRWAGRVAGSELAGRWDRRTSKLAAHERRHAEHGILAAKAIQDRVAALEPARTCRDLNDSVNSMSQGIIAKYREEDREYDRGAPPIEWEPATDTKTRVEDWSAWIASRGASGPQRAPSPAPTDVALTDTDRQRLAGTARFEADMAALSATADSAAAAWRFYLKVCPENSRVAEAAAAGGRDWLGHAWAAMNAPGAASGCAEGQAFRVLAEQIKNGICRAEERARQSFVYPGTRRGLRTKHGLDWDGWDRTCR